MPTSPSGDPPSPITGNDAIARIRAALAEELGVDLADSLVRAARNRGQLDLDLQLAINDGLLTLAADQRARVIGLIDSLMRGSGKAEPTGTPDR